jgi:CRISPR system Cascade subunit CasE
MITAVDTLHLTSVPMTHPAVMSTRWDSARAVHHAVMSVFGDLGESSDARANGGVLFRVEHHVDAGRVLVQSTVRPAVDGLATRTIPDLTGQFVEGQPVTFTVYLNAAKSVNRTSDGAERTHRTGIARDELPGWIAAKMAGGLTVDPSRTAPPLVRTMPLGKTTKGGHLVIAEARGIGHVSDPDVLISMIRDGVGRAKAYGCGLLTLRPA